MFSQFHLDTRFVPHICYEAAVL